MNNDANKKHSSNKHRWIGWLVGTGAVLLLAAWGATLVLPLPAKKESHVTFNQQNIERGAYLARVGDCVACHSKTGAPEFAGGAPILSPIGGMVPPNITPDLQYGIGKYTYGEFARALRHGVARDGTTLYPSMPWPSYRNIAESDMQALYAYFMKGVPAVAQASPANSIPWPLSIRWPLTYWRWLFGPTVPEPLPEPPSGGIALGAYYVEGLGHCGACHTPRNALTMNEKALSNNQNGLVYLSGGQVIDGYATPSLRGEVSSGLGNIKPQALIGVLKSGHHGSMATFGPMSEVVVNSTQYMTDADLAAMADYLKSLAPYREESPSYYDGGNTFKLLSQRKFTTPGAELYQKNCAACHLANGLGSANRYPALALNPATMNPDASGLIQIVLAGSHQAATQDNQAVRYFMPSYATRLYDQEIANTLTFIRSSWGNKASAVIASQVSAARENLPAKKD
ncbi:c-type cytochrome [Serratia sp. NPDC078593]|uniref:c-type cytochrome n=1 Tax=unclassified Serratia (in: enterobacteria) TaxID=2647522 RepID=UPI0037D18446